MMRAKSIAAAHEVYSRLFNGAKILELPEGHAGFDARGNFFRLSNSMVWFSAYAAPISIAFANNSWLRLHYGLGGTAELSTARQKFPILPNRGCVISTDMHPIIGNYGPDFINAAFFFDESHLKQKLAALTGATINGRLEFDPVLDFDKPEAAHLRRTANSLVECLDAFGSKPPALLLAELEQVLMVALLCDTRHNYSHLLDREPSSVAPWQVQRAEQYIEAHWNRPIIIEDVAAAAGTSVRSVFRQFKQSRGYSPMDFARQIRLGRAKQMLDRPDAQTTVTDVAFACGFSDLGRFSKEYRQSFGELPSEALRRSRGVGSTGGEANKATPEKEQPA